MGQPKLIELIDHTRQPRKLDKQGTFETMVYLSTLVELNQQKSSPIFPIGKIEVPSVLDSLLNGSLPSQIRVSQQTVTDQYLLGYQYCPPNKINWSCANLISCFSCQSNNGFNYKVSVPQRTNKFSLLENRPSSLVMDRFLLWLFDRSY